MIYISKSGRNLFTAAACFSAVLIILTFIPAGLNAESLFLKDGSIVEGKIKSETDMQYQIITGDKKTLRLSGQRLFEFQMTMPTG